MTSWIFECRHRPGSCRNILPLALVALALSAGSGAAVANDAMIINEIGDVGIGTSTPVAPLHILRNDGTLSFLVLQSEEAGPAQDRPMMQLTNNGGIRFQFDNPLLNTAWRFQAATGNQDNFEITKVGTGAIEMRLDSSGNLTLQGTLTQNSDVNAKQDIAMVDGERVLAQLMAVPITEWTYRSDAPGIRHLGPMAQDFHAQFGLGADATKLAPGDLAGVALAAIQAQQQHITQLEMQTQQLQSRIAELETLEARFAELEIHLPQRLAMD